MSLSARESFLQACPDLYKKLEFTDPGVSKLQRIGNQVVKQLDEREGTSSEAWINSLLLEYAIDRDMVVIMNQLADDKMQMPFVEGSIIDRKYRPLETQISKDDEDLAVELSNLCQRLTCVFGENIAFNHGDLGLNNILDQNGHMKVLDFEHAYFTEPNDKFNNISQLITRVWFDLPLALALTRETISFASDTGQFRETLQKHINKKRLRGLANYPEFTTENVPLTRDLLFSLSTIENSARKQN